MSIACNFKLLRIELSPIGDIATDAIRSVFRKCARSASAAMSQVKALRQCARVSQDEALSNATRFVN